MINKERRLAVFEYWKIQTLKKEYRVHSKRGKFRLVVCTIN